ncbi:hypothetical protein HN51_029593 [Arachis hypogaea]
MHALEDNKKGVVRMKIVVRKSELKQLVEVMNNNNNNNDRTKASSRVTAEQRLNQLLQKKNKKKNFSFNNNKSWSPGLQSIPE